MPSGISPNLDILGMPVAAAVISSQRRARIDAWRHEIALSAAECKCTTRSLVPPSPKEAGDTDSGFVSLEIGPQSLAVDGCTGSIDGIYTYIGKNLSDLPISDGGVDNMQAQGQSFPICHNCARLGAPVFMGKDEVNNSSSSRLSGTASLPKLLYKIARHLPLLLKALSTLGKTAMTGRA
ncbi:hypothetical protein ACRALDRAFT_1069746 [Sodiomyces alcalophilus JCM 7366]|uniref:uncharacterized protein n=1 Tax=Sodiomyces alcalophilus JCM 7366 TaxID=591952 RepID=UPI0039B3BEAB